MPLAALDGPLPASAFRAGSKLHRIDQFLRATPYHWDLGPTHIALLLIMDFNDGTVVEKQEVWTVLKSWGYTRKKKCVVPARGRAHERLAHLTFLRSIRVPNREDMFVFIDEKTFKGGEVKERIGDYGYAPEGQRVQLRTPFAPYQHVMPQYSGVVGALGVVAAGPMLDGGVGDLGLFCYSAKWGEALTTDDIVYFVERVLSPYLTPYPGPRSVVILDNAPGHRALTNFAQQRILTAVQRRGAHIVWNPPYSPDMNPIEHIWHVSKALMKRRVIEIASGRRGVARPFAPADLDWCLQTARLSRLAISDIYHRPL